MFNKWLNNQPFIYYLRYLLLLFLGLLLPANTILSGLKEEYLKLLASFTSLGISNLIFTIIFLHLSFTASVFYRSQNELNCNLFQNMSKN